MAASQETVLAIRNLAVHFPVREGTVIERQIGTVKAVDGVNLELHHGEVVGLVGESGCGKSTLARSVVGLAPVTRGEILFDGRDIANLTRTELRAIRPALQMIFQDPYASLNPRMNVFDAIAEPLLVHKIASRADVTRRVTELMERVGLAARLARKYPHEFSGGQRQRIAIARALGLGPRLLIADEPVSALDVSVQAQILNLIAGLCRDEQLTLLLISHDLSVVRHLANRIAVMYLGKIVEIGDAEDVFTRPRHPYTRALLGAIPVPDPSRKRDRAEFLLRGDPASPINPPAGCAFHPRCPYAEERCKETVPALVSCGGIHEAACIRLDEI